MAKFFTSPQALAQWLKENNSDAVEASTRLLNIVQDSKFEQDISESCRRIFSGTDEGASGVLHNLLAKYEITEAVVAAVNEKMKKVYAANELYKNKTIAATTRDKMVKEAQIMRQPGQYDMPLRICPKLPKQSAGQGLISTYNCRHYCLDSIVFDDNPMRVICAEAMWRRHVMDKFSREWQDPKTGKLVGGYINQRFYVFPDAGTPSNPDVPRDHGNNMALAPHERSRVARPHEYSIERRMEEARKAGSTKPITLSPLNDSTNDRIDPKVVTAAKKEPKKVSNCCFAVDHLQSEDGPSWSDVGRCPSCKKGCEFIIPYDDNNDKPAKKDKKASIEQDISPRAILAAAGSKSMIRISSDIMNSVKGDDDVFAVYSKAIDLHNNRVPAHEAAVMLKDEFGMPLGSVVAIQSLALKKMASHQADVYVTAQTIPADGIADGGEPYTNDEMSLMSKERTSLGNWYDRLMTMDEKMLDALASELGVDLSSDPDIDEKRSTMEVSIEDNIRDYGEVEADEMWEMMDRIINGESAQTEQPSESHPVWGFQTDSSGNATEPDASMATTTPVVGTQEDIDEAAEETGLTDGKSSSKETACPTCGLKGMASHCPNCWKDKRSQIGPGD
jgi:hypothetical protein